MPRFHKSIAATVLLSACLGARAQTAPRSSVLTPDACVAVADGDTVTFEWNPAFDPTPATFGVRAFSLFFAKAGDEESALRTHNGVTLSAELSRGDAEPAIVNKGNGIYQFVFHVNVRGAEPATYKLISATADPVDKADDQSRPLTMTNSPLRYPFCLVVTANGPRR